MTTLKPIKTQAFQIVTWQLIIIMGLAVVLFLLRGIQSGCSAMLGGLAYWLPTFALVWRVFARASVSGAKEFVVAFLAGEAVKLFLSAALFVLIVKYLPVTVLSVLIGYIGAIVGFWIAAMFFLNSQQGVSQ